MRRAADPALTFALGGVLILPYCSVTVLRVGRGTIDVSEAAACIVAAVAVAWCAVHLAATLIVRLTARLASPPPPGPGVVRLPGSGRRDRRERDAA